MSSYQEYFRKKSKSVQPLKVNPNNRKNTNSKVKSKGPPVVLGLFVSVIAAYGCWYGLDGELGTAKLVNKIEVTFFGEASASETKPEKPADNSKSKTEKSADHEAKAKDESPGPESAAAKNWTDEEVSLFSKLESRKKELDEKEGELKKLEEELQKQREAVERKLAGLEKVREQISVKLDDKVKTDQSKIDALMSVYSNMKPAQAAKVIETLNEDLAVEVLAKMKNKSAAEILNAMSSDKAKKLSERFAGYK